MNKDQILALLSTILTDSYLLQKFTSQVQLVATVDKNYQHIIELDNLIDLLRMPRDYSYQAQAAQLEQINKCVYALAQNTHNNHYSKGELAFSVHDVLRHLQLVSTQCEILGVDKQAALSRLHEHILMNPENLNAKWQTEPMELDSVLGQYEVGSVQIELRRFKQGLPVKNIYDKDPA